MNILFIAIGVAVIIFCYSSLSKIDEKEKVALETPGRADKLRANYSGLITTLLCTPSHTILMERKYDESIRIGNTQGQELFIRYSSLGKHGPQIHVACIENSVTLKEWRFDQRHTDYQIQNEISYYFK